MRHGYGRSALVTGGAGFVGSHLCERLLGDNARVVCMDNLDTGRERNVRQLLHSPGFRFVRHDVRHPIDTAPFDEIYHLASPASPPHYQRDPVRTLESNLLGAMHVLDLARRSGARVLLASTSEVYGQPEVHPQPEGYCGHVSTTGPRACYDEAKRCAETLFFAHRTQWDAPIKVARIFNTYGPRMRADDGRVVSNFVVQALAGRNLTVYGDGTQTRSFCFVDDLVEGLVRLMRSADEMIGPVNLGNPQEVTVRELARRVIAMTGASSRIVHRPLPQDDPVRRCPDVLLASTRLGWRPRIPLEEGLRRTIEHFRTARESRRLPADSRGGASDECTAAKG